MKKNKLVYIVIFLFSYSLGNGQINCLDSEPLSATSVFPPSCSEIERYFPSPTDPEKVIRINIHVMQNEDPNNPGQVHPTDPGNFTIDQDEVVRAIVKNSEAWVFKTINPLLFQGPVPNAPWIEDTRIRFDIANVFYRPDDVGIINNTPCNTCPFTNNYLFNAYNPDSDCILNLYLIEHPSGGTGWGPSGGVLMNKSYTNHITNVSASANAYNFAHEMGHHLGIHHVWCDTQIALYGLPSPHCAPTPSGCTGGISCSVTFCNPNFDPNCSNNVMSYSKINNHLTPLQQGQITRSLIHGFQSQYLKTEYDSSYDVDILADEIWESGKHIGGSIIISAGATLTIKCKVIMPPDGKIIVRPGGKLIVDQGEVTIASSKCGDYWAGICAWGRSGFPQTETNQSSVEIINEGTISYAKVGIQTFDEVDLVDGGGAIIKCNDAFFINNTKSVDFGPYTNEPNISEFINSRFQLDDDYAGGFFQEHVKLNQVTNIPFLSCDFKNERSHNYYDLYTFKGMGINAIDSDFTVTQWCESDDDPCTTWSDQLSSFSGLWMGVRSSMTGVSNNTFEVDRTSFVRNHVGILSSGVTAPLITRNDFEVGVDYFYVYPPIGLYLNGSTGYIVEENEFAGMDDSRITVGLLTRESGAVSNEIRSNSFKDLHVANLSNGMNLNPSNPTNGLSYACNRNNSMEANNFDFSVPNEAIGTNPFPGPNPPNQDHGISTMQGAFDEAAGNSFSHLGNPESDFKNNSASYNVTYFFDVAPPLEEPLTVTTFPKVNPSGTSSENECLINFSALMDHEDESDRRASYHQNKNAYDAIRLDWTSKIDGGNTDALLNQIATSSSATSNQLKSKMTMHSPWLSKEVVFAASDRTDLFTHSELYDLLVANPDVLKRKDVLTYLKTKLEPMPSNMTTSLETMVTNATERTNLESNLSHYKSNFTYAATHLSNFFMHDRYFHDMDSVRLWLSRQESVRTDMTIVDSWLHEGNIASAENALILLGQSYEMSATQQVELAYFRSLKELQIRLIKEDKSVKDMGVSDLEKVIDLASNSRGIAGIQAKNILNTSFGHAIYDEPILPEPTEELRINNGNSNEKVTNRITAFPNPANQNVQFQYNLDQDYVNLSIRIFDSSGSLIEEIGLPNGKEGFLSWNSGKVEEGFYLYSIASNKHNLVTGKLVVAR